eukprot:748082-Hanusia_phi.AAC.1
MGSSVSKGKSANQKQDFVLQGQGVKKGKEQAAADAHPTKHPATTQHKASKTNATHARSTPSSSGVDKAKGQQHGTAAAEPKAAPQSAAKATKLTPEEQEQISIDLQFAQKFRAFQASADSAQSKGNDVLVPENPAASKQLSDEERRRKRDQQEQLSLDQQAVQQFNAMSKMMAEREKASKDKEEERKRLEEQEQISIDQQMAQQFRDFVKVKEQENTHGDVKAQSRNQSEKTGTESKEKALKEADDLLDAFAPPKSKKAADAEEDSRVDRSNSQGTEEEEGVPLATEFSPDAGSQEDRDSVSCIVAGKLYLTNFRGVERTDELQRLDIRHIVCVNEQNNEFPDQFNYFNIDTLEDQEDHDATVHFSAVIMKCSAITHSLNSCRPRSKSSQTSRLPKEEQCAFTVLQEYLGVPR